MLFHLADPTDWAARTETGYVPAAFAGEGFIHLSSAEQLVGTFLRYYSTRTDLVLLTIDDTLPAIQDSLVWESMTGGPPFPHLYARLSLDSIVLVEANWTPPE